MDCIYCYGKTIKRGGYGKEGQRYKCSHCHKTFSIGSRVRKTYSFQDKKDIVARCNGRGNKSKVCKLYHISKNTITKRTREINRYNHELQMMMGYY